MIFASIFTHPLTDLFWASASIGTTLFMLRMMLMLVGGLVDCHHDDGNHYDHSHDHGPSLKLVTFHSLAGFFMMFGWSGLAAREQLGFSTTLSCVFALIIGFSVMVIVALLFKMAKKLEAYGTAFTLHQTIGLTGIVYQYIPAHGHGKIHVNVHGVTRELLAQSHTHEPIDSFEAIKIINIIDQEIVQVVLLRKEQP